MLFYTNKLYLTVPIVEYIDTLDVPFRSSKLKGSRSLNHRKF